jgi:translation initiation factor IF-1
MRFVAEEILEKGTISEVDSDLRCRVRYDDGFMVSAVIPEDIARVLLRVVPGDRVWVSTRGSATPQVRAFARDD